MNNLFLKKLRFGEMQGTALLFFQALTFQILFYPIIILNIVRNSVHFLNNLKIVTGVLLIILAAISISIRGASYELVGTLLRFYCGIILVSAAFILNKTLKISYMAMWIFAFFVFYEFLCLHLGSIPLSYANFDNAGIMDEIEARVSIGENLVRTFGPSMNSSVSGSILAVMIFIVLSRDAKLTRLRSKALLLTLFSAFVLCGSISAMATFIFLMVNHVFSQRKLQVGVRKNRYVARLFPIYFFILLSISFAIYMADGFFSALFSSKFNLDYLLFVLDYKLFQLEVFENLHMVLLGANLMNATVISTGGDFIILSFIYHFGLVFVVAFLSYLFFICSPENRVFLLAGILSSLHYGTLFSLTGQAFFGAIIAGSVCVDSRARKYHARPTLIG